MQQIQLSFQICNCPIHKNVDFDGILGPSNIQYRFLPRYSPDLNPIENVFGFMKARYKRILATEYGEEMLNTTKLDRGFQMATRDEIMQTAFTRALSSVTVQEVNDYINHAGTFFKKVYNRETF